MKAEEYGEKFYEHLVEQYKLYVEMADRISIRRTQTNRFYISLLSGLIALLSLVASKGTSIISVTNISENIVLLIFAFLGLALCFIWIVNIHSYRQLNSGKFKVIHEMEQSLPFPCYDREWEILGRGKEGKNYLQLTRIEKYVPFTLAVPYILILIYLLVRLLSK